MGIPNLICDFTTPVHGHDRAFIYVFVAKVFFLAAAEHSQLLLESLEELVPVILSSSLKHQVK